MIYELHTLGNTKHEHFVDCFTHDRNSEEHIEKLAGIGILLSLMTVLCTLDSSPPGSVIESPTEGPLDRRHFYGALEISCGAGDTVRALRDGD